MEGRRIYVKHPSYYSDSLVHYGKEGMHWGERLYQYKDGSLTPLGRIHYGVGQARVKRAEQAAVKAKAKAEQESDREKRKYQNKDGTLKLRGKIHYKTTDKYALLTDDEIRQQTNRLQLQKNLEEMKKQTSATYRLQNKLDSAAEDLAVFGFRKAGEKLINHFVDKGVSKLLGTDKEDVAKGREIAEKLAGMSTKEIKAMNDRNKAEKEAYERLTGDKLPKDYEYSDLTEEELKGVKKSEKQDNSPSKSSEKKKDSSKPKSEEQKSSDSKKEENRKLSDSEISEIKAAVRKGDSVEEVAEKTNHSTSTVEKYANIKSPAMTEVGEKKQTPPMARQRMVSEELTKPYVNKKTPSLKEYDGKAVVRVHRVNLDDEEKKKKKDK